LVVVFFLLLFSLCFFFVFFFFQAEDGIRDFHVTGVQTCALPIYNQRRLGAVSLKQYAREAGVMDKNFLPKLVDSAYGWTVRADRSEERRVGKECRSRGAAEE